MKAILGISAFYHDSAAALVADGEILAAAQEERFTRKKHDAGFPAHAIAYCLKEAGLKSHDLHAVVFYDKPWAKFERIIENYLAVAPAGFSSFLQAIPVWLKDKMWMSRIIDKALGAYQGELLFCRHHESHAASAFYPSPFAEAAVLTLDGVGEWHTTAWGVGQGNKLELRGKIDYPHSLGLLYSAITYYTGFKVNSGEYKVMGLAPYGRPDASEGVLTDDKGRKVPYRSEGWKRYRQLILDELLDLKEDGSFRLNMDYFEYHTGLRMTNSRFHRLFGGEPRPPESWLTQKEMDLARAVQEVVNEAILRLGRHVRTESGQKNLCLAGGVALNCVANGELLRAGIFDRLWIQPASGDAGGALGAALFAWHQLYGGERKQRPDGADHQKASRLGPRSSPGEIEAQLGAFGAKWHRHEPAAIPGLVADLIASGKVIGWHQGRMEFGPRALGGRSILGDPRSADMQKVMNLKIKYRESFRPFAPSVLVEESAQCFEGATDSPYMLLVFPVAKERCIAMSEQEEGLFGLDKLNVKRSDLPAITHVDYSARVQTVAQGESPEYHALIKAFFGRTGCPVLINTSFNVRGEPIVCTPADSYRCFMRTEMDVLVVEDFVMHKSEQPPWKEKGDWKSEFGLD